ncbi:MAG: hypothetical protein LLG01_08440 [Planctomycetaceae bacterium]|nr:hypothetical protein [Planctomycetaceae bacterium]
MKRSDKLLVTATLAAVVLVIAFVWLLAVPRYETSEKLLSSRARLVERWYIRTFPPFVWTGQRILDEQTLWFDGEVAWSSKAENRLSEGIHVSPDNRWAVIEDWMHDRPLIILNLSGPPSAKGQRVMVNDPQPNEVMHDYVYSLGFVRWNDDSKSFLAAATGTDWNAQNDMVAWRELWKVSPEDGRAERVKRLERPWQQNRDSIPWPE